jgi:hypothetical protein
MTSDDLQNAQVTDFTVRGVTVGQNQENQQGHSR